MFNISLKFSDLEIVFFNSIDLFIFFGEEDILFFLSIVLSINM